MTSRETGGTHSPGNNYRSHRTTRIPHLSSPVPAPQYIVYKARAVALPWSPAQSEPTEAEKLAVYQEIAQATGVTVESLGYKPEAEAKQ